MTKATRRRVTAAGTSTTKQEAELKRANAFRRLFAGTPGADDADIVLTQLCALAGFFRPPNYAEWMARTGTPAGFELHCALHAARAEPIRRILDYLDLSDDEMIALEKAVREASQR